MKSRRIAIILLFCVVIGLSATMVYARPPQQGALFSISYGQSETEFLNQGEQHIWQFTGAQGDIVTIDMVPAPDQIEQINGLRDPYLELLDANGNQLIVNDDGGDGLNARILDYPLPATGNYFIIARTFGSSDEGLYRITLQGRQQPCTFALAGSAGTMAYNSTQRGVLGETNRCGDRWTFTGTAGDRVTIAMNSSAFDTYLELWRGSSAVTTNDDGGEGLNSLIEDFTVPQSGTFTIWAHSFGHNGSGAYSLSLSGGPPSCSFGESRSAGSITYNSSRSGSIGANNRCGDRWTFSGRGGERVTVAIDGEFDTYLELYDPNGRQITFNDDGGEGLNSLIDGFRLPVNGTYTVWAHAFNHASVGSYNLSLSQQVTPTPTFTRTFTPTRTPTRTPTITITPNTTCRAIPLFGAAFHVGPDTQSNVVGSITPGEELPVTGRTGDNVWWRAVSSGRTGWFVRDDIEIAGNCSSVTVVPPTATPTRITPTVITSTPTPTPEIGCPDAFGSGRLISYGETVTGSILQECTESWLFSGTEGEDIRIETLPVSGLDTVLTLYDINDNLITEDDNSGTDLNARIETRLPHTGQYIVVVSGFGSAAGGYTMSLSLITGGTNNPLLNPLLPLLGGLGVVTAGAGGGLLWYLRRNYKRRNWQKISSRDKTFPRPCETGKFKVTREPIEVQPALWGIEHVHYQMLNPVTGEILQRRGALKAVIDHLQDALRTTRWNNRDDKARDLIILTVQLLSDDIALWMQSAHDSPHVRILVDAEGSEIENEFNAYRCQASKGASNWKQVAKWSAQYKDRDTRVLTTLSNLVPGQSLSNDDRWRLNQLLEDFLSRL